MFWEDRVSSKCLLLYRQPLCSVNKCIFCILPPSWIYFLLCISTALTFLSHQHHPPILSQQPPIQLACLLLDTNAGTESFVSCRFPDTPSAPKLKPKLPNTGYGFLVDPFKLPLCNPMNCGTPGFPVIHHLWSLVKLMSIESVMPSNQPSSVVPSPPSIRVFSNQSALPIRWPKYRSSSFSISASNEHSGLISFRMDWLDLLAGQGTLKSLLHTLSLCPSSLGCLLHSTELLPVPYSLSCIRDLPALCSLKHFSL